MESNPARYTRCLYCGASYPWWQCSCLWAREAQEGKRAKPKVLNRNGRQVIVLDAEAAALNALGLERYVSVKPVVAEEAVVKLEDEVLAAAVKPGFDRVEYMRAYMRRKREEKKARGE